MGGATDSGVEAQVYQYAPADANGNPVLHANGKIAWQDGLPDGLTGSGLAFGGSGISRTAAATIGAYSGNAAETKLEDDLRRERLLENTALYGLADNQDLSLYDIDNLHAPRSSGKPTTANCYIVDRAGSYRFPLVYGNAIDWTRTSSIGYKNGVNLYSFYDGATSDADADDVYHHLQNGNGDWIESPYILNDLGLAENAVEAVIVWEDGGTASSPLITVTSDVCSFSSSYFYQVTKNSNKRSTVTDTPLSQVPYIQFSVSQDNLCQGNALIALRRKSDKVIVWSWHIWVTDGYDVDGDGKGDGMHSIRVKSEGSSSYWMFPFNIGWCGYNTVSRYKDRVWYISIRQPAGKAKPLVFKVIQAPPVTVTAYKGNEPFYQWGRKDPFIPSDGMTAETSSSHDNNRLGRNKTAYSLSSDYSGYLVRPDENGTANTCIYHIVHNTWSPVGSLKGAINNPHGYLCWQPGDESNVLRMRIWMREKHPHNLWNMANGNKTATDLPVSKTVYDPCPPGYNVPRMRAFVNFSYNNRTELKTNGETRVYAYMYTSGYGEMVFFPMSGVRECYEKGYGVILSVKGDGLSWTAAPYNSNGSAYNFYYDSADNELGTRPLHANKWTMSCPVRPIKE